MRNSCWTSGICRSHDGVDHFLIIGFKIQTFINDVSIKIRSIKEFQGDCVGTYTALYKFQMNFPSVLIFTK